MELKKAVMVTWNDTMKALKDVELYTQQKILEKKQNSNWQTNI